MESAGIPIQRKRSGPGRWNHTSGADRVGPTRHRPVARAWKGSSLVLKPKCLHTYELLNSSRYRTGLGATGSEFFLEALRGVWQRVGDDHRQERLSDSRQFGVEDPQLRFAS